MHVLWLHADIAGCGSYRCYFPALGLDEIDGSMRHTFRLHQHLPAQGTIGEDGQDFLDGVDVVVFQRPIGTVFLDLVSECRRRGISTVLELDDDVFHIQKQNPAYHFWTRKDVLTLLRDILGMVDHVIASTVPLADVLREEGQRAQRDVSVCANHLHPYIWQEAIANVVPYASPDKVVIGWQGSITHDTDFKVAIPALKRILAEHPEVVLRFFGSVPLSIKGEIPAKRFQWVRGVPFVEYPAKLKFLNYDIALAPITPSRFNESKSNLKVLEAWSLGQPVVASQVYPYAYTIDDGRTGFVAEDREQWYKALKALVTDPELRQRVGAAGRAEVWEKWGPSHTASWQQVFRSLRAPAMAQVTYDSPVSVVGLGAPVGAPQLEVVNHPE
jgi:glycosyltransferase involved in cell wall biosynthesis